MRNSDQLSLPFAVLTSVTGLTTQMFLCLAVLIVIIAIHIYTLILLIVLQHTKTANVSIIMDYVDEHVPSLLSTPKFKSNLQ